MSDDNITTTDTEITEAQPEQEQEQPAIERLPPTAPTPAEDRRAQIAAKLALRVPGRAEPIAGEPPDPYFRKADGTAVTGAPKQAEDADDESDDEEQPERIGDAWVEVRNREQAIAAEAARIEAEQERIAEAEREAAEARARYEAEHEAMHTDLHSYLKRNGLSFFELVKADLERQDRENDPLEIARAEAEAAQQEAAELQAEREAEREREQQEAATVALAEERSALRSILEEVQDDAPHIAAFGIDRVIEEVQARYYELAEAGEQPNVPRLFAEAEALLAERARRFASIEAEPEQVEDDEPEAPEPTRKRVTTISNRTAAARHSGPPKYADSGERARAIAHKFLRWRDDSGAIH